MHIVMYSRLGFKYLLHESKYTFGNLNICLCVCVFARVHACTRVHAWGLIQLQFSQRHTPKIFRTMKIIRRLFSTISRCVTCICGSKEMGITGHEVSTREGDPNVPSLAA